MNRLIAFCLEDVGLQENHNIPGLNIYSRDPIKGINFFKRQTPITITAYCTAASLCLYTLFTRGSRIYKSSLTEWMCLVLASMSASTMTFIKLGLYLMLSGINMNENVHQIKLNFKKRLRSNLYGKNIKYTVSTNIFHDLLLIFSLVKVLYSAIFGSFTDTGSLFLLIATAILSFRQRMLQRQFNTTFTALSTATMNPYSMEVEIYKKPEQDSNESINKEENQKMSDREIQNNETPLNREANSQEENHEHQNDTGRIESGEVSHTSPNQTECVICMTDYEEGDRLLIFGCTYRHKFHEDCLSKWLTSKETCPLCKQHV